MRTGDGLHVVIIHQGEDLPTDPGYAPLRYGRLAALLSAEGARVTRLAPSFRHLTRTTRSTTPATSQSGVRPEGRAHIVPTHSYKGSLSLDRARFTSDFLIGSAKFLRRNRATIDAVLVGVPPPGMVLAARLALGRKGHMVADVRDVWPDCLAVGPRAKWEPQLKIIGKMLSQEMRLANKTVAVSQPMLEWVPTSAASAVVPIGLTGRPLFPEHFADADDAIRVCFISNHTMGFDFVPVLNGWQTFVQTLDEQESSPELVFIGAEPEDPAAHSLALHIDSVRFGGRVDPSGVGEMMSRFDVGLAPTTPRFGDSLANKVFDYVGAGLFVSHSIDPMVSRPLDENGLGEHVELSADAWAQHFRRLHADRARLRATRSERMSEGENQFGSERTTRALVDQLLSA